MSLGPECSKCGTSLHLESDAVVELVYEGVVCKKCGAVTCPKCGGQPGKPCPRCGGPVLPATERVLQKKSYRRLLVPLGIGLAAVAVLVAAVFYKQRGAHVELKGSILKVRTAAMDENSSVAVVDFRFVNPADYAFVVRQVNVSITGADGKTYEGMTISEMDARRLFEFYKSLGQKFNDSLLMRDKVAARQTEDRMIAARFEIPQGLLDDRKNLIIRIEDVDGPVSELRER